MAGKNENAVGAGDALPMQKASPVAFIVGGVAVVVLGGLVVYGMSGGDGEASAEAVATEKAANAAQGMTKAELEEQQAHLKRTQTALIAAAAEEEEEKKAQQQAAAQQRSQAQAAAAPAPKPSAAPQKKPVNSKKSMDGLDALGADITSALE